MSAHMRTLHTKLEGNNIIHIFNNTEEYAIPLKEAKKYIIKEKKKRVSEGAILGEELFKDLHDKYTKAGTLLRGVRAREGMTQVQFAKIINISQVNLSHMENGRRPVGKEIAARIAKAFKVNPSYFHPAK